MQANDLSFPIVTSRQCFAHHGLCQALQQRDGQHIALKRQLEVTSHLLVCLIVQNKHPTINFSMPNNFHDKIH